MHELQYRSSWINYNTKLKETSSGNMRHQNTRSVRLILPFEGPWPHWQSAPCVSLSMCERRNSKCRSRSRDGEWCLRVRCAAHYTENGYYLQTANHLPSLRLKYSEVGAMHQQHRCFTSTYIVKMCQSVPNIWNIRRRLHFTFLKDNWVWKLTSVFHNIMLHTRKRGK